MRKRCIAVLTFVIIGLCSWGQYPQDTFLWNLHFNLGASMVTDDIASGPAIGLELLNPGKKISFAYRGDYPFNIGKGTQIGDYNLRLIKFHSLQFLEIKYNNFNPERSLLTGSFGICWLAARDNMGLHDGDLLLTASISYPIYWLRCEIRLNLFPNDLTTTDSKTIISHLSVSAVYRFKPFQRY